MSLKNPVTPPGIDPGTVRLVAQRINYYASTGNVTEDIFCIAAPSTATLSGRVPILRDIL